MKSLKRLSLVIAALFIVVLSSKTSVSAETQYSENVIPKMTGYTSPSGEVTCSSELNANSVAWYAFDHVYNTNGGWMSAATDAWIGYRFDESKSITKYAIYMRGQEAGVGNRPIAWTFEAWDELENTWVVLDTQTNINPNSWSSGSKKEFTLINSSSYYKYRFNFKATASYYISIGEIEMMETVSPVVTAPTNLKLVLEKNEVKQLSVSEDLSDNTELTWTSSDTTIATVDASGKVKALKPGNTIITCTSSDGEYTDAISVLVVDLDYQLAVDLLIGEKCRLTVDDLKDTTNVTWTVNDPTIATITSKGKVTAVGEGLTFITATDEGGKEIGKIFIRVRIKE